MSSLQDLSDLVIGGQLGVRPGLKLYFLPVIYFLRGTQWSQVQILNNHESYVQEREGEIII